MASQTSDRTIQQDATDRAYDRVITLIARRELLAGNLIEPREIASELNISMSPVTRALQRLEQEGLVKIIPRKGTFVENSSPQTMFDHLMMREAIECQAARIYCGKPVEDNMETLLKLARNFDKTSGSGTAAADPGHWFADVEFHTYLVGLTRCSDLIRAFRSSMQIGLLVNVSLLSHAAEPPESHEEFVRSLTTTDSDAAEQLVRHHLRHDKPSPVQMMAALGHQGWNDL